ncbi:MAG: RIFT barrel domain-containing protein [Armatimonadota bacterium]
MRQPIALSNRMHLPLAAQPIRQGVPWPQGAVPAEAKLSALDEDGRTLPCASRVLNRWPDGSVQWSLVDLAVDLPPTGKRTITIDSEAAATADVINPVIAREADGRITLENGLASLTFGPEALIEEWTCGGRRVIEDGGFDVLLTGEDGAVYSAGADRERRVFIEEAGPLCAVVRVEGKHRATDGRTLLHYWLRFRLTANRPDLRVTYHYHNLEDAEPGINLRSLVLEMRTALPADSARALVQACRGRDTRPEYVRLPEDLEICASNNMDLEQYEETHQRAGITGGGYGRVFLRDPSVLRDDPLQKPWFLRRVVDFKFQSRDDPAAYVYSYLGLVSAHGSLVVAGGNMVGLHPKSLSVTGSTVRYAVWPEWAGVMDVTQGEGRTLDFFAGPLPPNVTDEEIGAQYYAWEAGSVYTHLGGRSTVAVSLDPAFVRECAVFHVEKLPAFNPLQHLAFERKVQAQWTPADGIPATGHWHYGDLFARWDIGANNEEMVGHMWFQEFLRTGRAECLEKGLAQARHIADVDICACSKDPYQNGGMCSHGPRHNHTAAYPSHMWFTEMLFAYVFTGDEEYLRAAKRVCDNLVFWINDPHGFEIICSDGREAGQPLINLSWCYRFIPDPRYLDAMWKIARECYMEKVRQYGTLTYMKPRDDMPLVRYDGYGEWAAWEGLFWLWELTHDEELKVFILGQLDWRLVEERMAVTGYFRDTDYNAAAYAYYLTGDPQWLHRVARPFRVLFRGVQWPIGYIKSMYYLKLAFEQGIVADDEVLIS